MFDDNFPPIFEDDYEYSSTMARPRERISAYDRAARSVLDSDWFRAGTTGISLYNMFRMPKPLNPAVALSYHTLTTRPKWLKSKARHRRFEWPSDTSSLTSSTTSPSEWYIPPQSDIGLLDDPYHPEGWVPHHSGDFPDYRHHGGEDYYGTGRLPPLNPVHNQTPLPPPSHFVQQMPYKRDVTLTTRFVMPHGAVTDAGAYRRWLMYIYPNCLRHPVYDNTAMPLAGYEWSHNAADWFTLYSKAHVYGWSLDLDIQPFSTPVHTAYFAAYPDFKEGIIDAPLDYSTLAGLSDWGSQPHGKIQNLTLLATHTIPYTFNWKFDIDCYKEYGAAANDNRLDTNSAGDAPEYLYQFYFVFADYSDVANWGPAINCVFTQHVTFYQPKSLVHA
nr:MAG: hypothetical protein [Arizlama virus]